jgi:hypothetical protein
MLYGAWLAFFPVLFLIPFSLVMSRVMPKEVDHVRIRAEGKEATARVVGVETLHNITINGTNPRQVRFTYQADGQVREGSMDTMSVETVAKWQPGQEIVIRYLGNEASVPALEPVDFPFWLFLWAPLPFMAVGVPFLLYAIAGARRQIDILRRGVAAKARFIAFAPVESRGVRFIKTQFEVSYAYVSQSGEALTGASLTTDLALLNEKKKGDELDILVLPHQENRSLLLDGPRLKKMPALGSAV